MDVPDICLLGEWRLANCGMTTLWQRIGRAARDRSLDATAIVFVEAKYFDEYQHEKQLKKAKRREKAARKRKAEETDTTPSKRMRIATTVPTSGTPSTIPVVRGNVPLPLRPIPLPNNPPPFDIATIRDEDQETASEEESEDEDDGVEGPEPTEPVADQVRAVPNTNQHGGTPDVDLLERRRQEYADKAREKKRVVKGGKKADEELDPEVMDFVNADWRGLGCRRVPVKLVFRCEKAGA